jgi:hypothetical protein
MLRFLLSVALALLACSGTRLFAADPATKAILWNLDNLESIGGHAVTVVGKPRIIEANGSKAIEFNGSDDALFVDANPLAGLKEFTAEVVFRPAAGGPKEQRFLHFQPAVGESRVLFETRLPQADEWFLDTYLHTDVGQQTLLAKDSLHACDRWYAAAIVVDGKTMRHHVNGQEELAAEVKFTPLAAGQTSIGVRFNKVHWFQGAIRQIRITPAVLKPNEFLKP